MTINHGGMLVAAPERWDEACYVVPAVRALIASGIGVGVLCAESQREFWATLDNLAVVDFSGKSKPKVVAAQLTGKWQASLAWGNGIAAEIFKLAGIPRRLGPSERKLNKLLTHPMGFTTSPLEHRVRNYLAAVEELGVETARPEYFAPASLGIESVAAAVLLSPGSDYGPSHEWPLDRWEEIANRLVAAGRRITVASVDGGRNLAAQLVKKLGSGTELFHANPMAETLPLLAVHGLVVAADSSLPHLAAHAGTTCVTLFGPNDPTWRRPLGRRHVVAKRHVECAPCLMEKCPLDMRCQQELDVDRVWALILEKLG